MGIYRGAGGTGDAVADSSSEALLVRNLAVEVQADADAAAASAAAASASASTASIAATNAQTAETNAETAEANAETAASSAASSASDAATSEANALQYASDAADSNTDAENHASAAATSASNAASSASTASTQATNASNSASAAATSATNASNSASAAATSATNAASSATAAAGSATSAASSASSATSSASNAATSATNAASSATTATTQAGIATTKASDATTSATNAASSASSASTSATSASGSASAASTSATNAAASASSASTSAATATTKASDAATSATNAASSATAAAGSASSALTSATNAANSATSASSSASTATTQATNATNSATAAAGSATSASNSASAASTSATNAANSASAASTSATNAATSASSAAASYDSFDDRYLGPKSVAPTLDNDGNTLLTGALYFNTVSNTMKVWSGSAWLDAYASLSGALLATNNLSDLANKATARTNLGVAIGTDVQAWDADLDTWATKTAPTGTVVGTSDTQTLTNKTLTTPTIDKINTSVANTSIGAGNASIMKNRIINGAMVIDQRNAGASVTITGTGVANYTLDRFAGWSSSASKYSIQQNAGSVTPPEGFRNYLGITSLASTSSGSTDYYFLNQVIEGFNIADLGWGTANAKTVTLSFWVRSSLTGTFGGSLENGTGARSYPFSYSIPVANTWTQISVTIAGDTTGTWATTNGAGILVNFNLGVGSARQATSGAWASGDYQAPTGATSVVGTNGATFYITGVQLEVGSSATGYEYRQYGQELDLCKRYCQWLPYSFRSNPAAGGSFGGSVSYSMRTAPSFASIVADPAASQLLGNATSYGYLAVYSGANGGYAQTGSTAGGDCYVLGYRSLATAEL